MNARLLSAFIALAGACPAHGALDLTPVTSEIVFVGVKSTLLNFKDKGRTISYGPPRGWTFAADPAGIRFTPPLLALAHAAIEQSPLGAPSPLNEETNKALQAAAIAAVPPESRNVTLVSEETNPLRIGNNDTYSVTVAYEASGQEFMMNVLYLHLPDTQVRFRAVARKDDFEKVQRPFRSSIFSWQWK